MESHKEIIDENNHNGLSTKGIEVEDLTDDVEDIEISGGVKTAFRRAIEKIGKKDTGKADRIRKTIGFGQKEVEKERIDELRNEIQESGVVAEELKKMPENERESIEIMKDRSKEN